MSDKSNDSPQLPRVSILMIARNEEMFIEKALSSLLNGTYPIDDLQVVVVDGRSDDRTVEVLQRLMEENDWPIEIYDNPGRLPPYGLNIGLEKCTGEYIARADAHSEYPSKYIEKLLGYIQEYPEAENVGGMFDVRPSAGSYMARAIACAYSHRFATGNAHYRTGVKKPSFVDTVPFGFFRRNVFEKYGRYDADLIRNEDGEFNHRIIRNGGKVLLVPDVSVAYYSRPDLKMLGRTFFQYGWFKPLAQAKLGKPVNFRQFAPILFVFAMMMLILYAGASRSIASLAPAGSLVLLYLTATAMSAWGATRKKSAGTGLIPGICLAFWTIHACFTSGYIKGIFDFLIRKKRVSEVPMTR